MARYTGPTTRINRRFRMPIFLPKKAFERKKYPPGQHGAKLMRMRKEKEYGTGLNEKQKLRFMYGLTEKQFRLTFEKAKRKRGITGEIFLQMLETRLDNVIYLLRFAKTRKGARQFVNHEHIQVNGQKVNIPSYRILPGDQIQVREGTSSRQLATRCLEETQSRTVPNWVSCNENTLSAVINRLPNRDEITQDINEQIIVEFYSR
jgi:small subunit ribosomal protein S4